MIWKGNGLVAIESGEPSFRSCWNCNAAHAHLKTVNTLHQCFECGQSWVFDRFLGSFRSTDAFDRFFLSHGMKPGQSTTTIDKGYRITKITLKMGKKRKRKP